MKYLIIIVIICFGSIYTSSAQQMNMSDTSKNQHKVKKDTAMDKMDIGDMDMMSSALSKNLPMGRDGSGTSWLPDASPTYGFMLGGGKWTYMIHGNFFLRYTGQDLAGAGSRGADKFDAPNWFMAMAQRETGQNGLLHFNLMMSLD